MFTAPGDAVPADFKSHVIYALLGAWSYIKYLAPYLVGGILIAAVINTFAPRDRFARILQIHKWWMLPISGLVGLVSPACTYGTVPIFVEMIKSGAPMAPAATFLIASSLVNPQMFLLTAGALGMWVALAQAVGSFAFAVAIGILISRAAARGVDLESSEIKAARKSEEERSPHTHKHQPHNGHSSKHHHKHAMMRKLAWPRRLLANVLDLAEFVGFYFVLGTVVVSLAAEFIPSGAVIAAVGEGKWWAVPFAAVVSIPTYICGGGTIPFIARAQAMGMGVGAALAFLIVGPATRVTALSALAVLFGKRYVLAYVVLLLLFAVLLGMAMGPLVPNTGAASFDPIPPYSGMP